MKVKLDSVVNLSDRHLTEEEMYVLALGFNFQPKFPGLPIEDIIASVEALSRKLPSDTSAQLRVGLFKILSDLKSNPKKMKSLNKSNLSSKHWKAILN